MKKKIIICGVRILIAICLCVTFMGKYKQTPVNKNQNHFEIEVLENVDVEIEKILSSI